MPTLEQIIETLNTISVSGRENLDKLLGCIIALEAMERRDDDAGQQD